MMSDPFIDFHNKRGALDMVHIHEFQTTIDQ